METKEENNEEVTEKTKEKFNDKVVEKNTIDMKIYNVPKKYALEFKKFADLNGMRFNSAMVLMLEKLSTSQKLEELENVIFENRTLIKQLYEKKEVQDTETETPVEKKIIKTYGK